MKTGNKEPFEDGEEPIDPKKLFDSNEYNTLLINRAGFNKNENNIADMMESLLDKDIERQQSEEIFDKLKKASAQELLVQTIAKLKRATEKSILTAACWESGLDFTPHFLFFVELALDPDYQLAIEALTVVQQTEGQLSKDILDKALALVEKKGSSNKDLLLDLLTNIRSRY